MFGNFPLSHDMTITIHPNTYIYIYINGIIKSLTSKFTMVIDGVKTTFGIDHGTPIGPVAAAAPP